jgi:hypothetical protein
MLLSQESSGNDAGDSSVALQAAGAPASSWADDESASMTICQIDDPSSDSIDGDGGNTSSHSTDILLPTTTTDLGDEMITGVSHAVDLGDGFDAEASGAIPPGTMNFAALWNAGASSQAAAGAGQLALGSAAFIGRSTGGQAAPMQTSQLMNISVADAAAGQGDSVAVGSASTATATAAPSSPTRTAAAVEPTTTTTTVSPAQTAPDAASTTADSGPVAAPLSAAHVVAAPNAGASPNASNASAPYSPAQIAHAYGFDQVKNQGTGQTIYIVDAYNNPNISADLKTFDTQWGLPNPTLTVHKMSSRISNDVNWGIEESLDVQWAHAMAPKANITLVEATSASFSALMSAVDWATNNGAHVVSMSWGGNDFSGESSYDSHFNHSGVTYIASAGDSGGVVEYPSASPYVLSVGGTSLTIDTNNNYVSESAWSSGGGGSSSYESQPTYQKNYGISGTGRSTPDVAYNGDPNTGYYVYDSYYWFGGGWFEVGGTSAGAPQWASLVAIVNQSRTTPLSTSSLTSRFDYNAAGSSGYSSNYHDITTGSNGYSAGTGYDLATGLGSPQANNLIGWLVNN